MEVLTDVIARTTPTGATVWVEKVPPHEWDGWAVLTTATKPGTGYYTVKSALTGRNERVLIKVRSGDYSPDQIKEAASRFNEPPKVGVRDTKELSELAVPTLQALNWGEKANMPVNRKGGARAAKAALMRNIRSALRQHKPELAHGFAWRIRRIEDDGVVVCPIGDHNPVTINCRWPRETVLPGV